MEINKCKYIIVLSVIVFVFLSIGCTNVDNADYESQKTTEVNTNVSFDDIFWAYFENEVNAKDTYYGNRYRITGYVDAIESDALSGDIVVGLSKITGRTMVAFNAVFENEQKEALKSIRVGDSLTFDGTCVDSQYWIKCVVIQ